MGVENWGKEVNNLDYPKLVIASDGYCTGLLLDGISMGRGIKRLDFSAENRDGEVKSTIRILDLDVATVSLEVESETHSFSKLMEGVTGIEKAVSEWTDTTE